MGSVHYTSPEQARGGFSDEKSDVYSLGVTLYEMLTGEVPFDGETTVAIAIRHIQEPMPSPKKLNPDIPYSVEQIVLKCCEKSPDRRYQTMDELAADLRHSLSDPEGTFVHRMAEDNLSETRSMTAKDREEIRRRTSASAGTAGAAAMAAKAGTGANAGAAANAATAAKAGTAAKTSTAAGAAGAAAAAGAETGSLSQETRGFTPVSAGSREQKTGSPGAGAGGSSQGSLYVCYTVLRISIKGLASRIAVSKSGFQLHSRLIRSILGHLASASATCFKVSSSSAEGANRSPRLAKWAWNRRSAYAGRVDISSSLFQK
jgi:hypothetical protein